MPALGFIETQGRVGAIEAADAALKAANVKLISIQKVSAGLVTVVIEGEVSAVKASIEAAKVRTRQMRGRIATNIIPGPTDETKLLIKRDLIGSKTKTIKKSKSRTRASKR